MYKKSSLFLKQLYTSSHGKGHFMRLPEYSLIMISTIKQSEYAVCSYSYYRRYFTNLSILLMEAYSGHYVTAQSSKMQMPVV